MLSTRVLARSELGREGKGREGKDGIHGGDQPITIDELQTIAYRPAASQLLLIHLIPTTSRPRNPKPRRRGRSSLWNPSSSQTTEWGATTPGP